MLCFPGLTPVANDAQAVGDSGECVVASGIQPPVRASRDRFGSLPAFIQRVSERRIHSVEPQDQKLLGRTTVDGDPDRQAGASKRSRQREQRARAQ